MLNFELLVKSPVFMGLKPDQLENIMDGIHFQVRRYEKNEQVVYAGDPCQDLLVVLSGSVKGEMADYTGKTIKIEDIEAPRPLAAAFLFGKNNRFPVNVIANEEVSLLCISRPEFLKILQKDQLILTNYLNSISFHRGRSSCRRELSFCRLKPFDKRSHTICLSWPAIGWRSLNYHFRRLSLLSFLQ